MESTTIYIFLLVSFVFLLYCFVNKAINKKVPYAGIVAPTVINGQAPNTVFH